MDTTQRISRRTLLITAAGALAVALLALLIAGQVLQRTQSGVLAGVFLEGEDVGGQTRAELEDTVDRQADRAEAEPVTVTSTRAEVTVDRGTVGAAVDRNATTEEVWGRGRSGLLTVVRDHLAARRGDRIDVELAREVDGDALERWATTAAGELSEPPRPAGIEFDASEEPPDGDDEARVLVTEPEPGQEVDPDELTQVVEDALSEPGPVAVDAPGDLLEPVAVDDDLEAVLPDARRAVSAPITLRHPAGGDDVEMAPADLAAVLALELDEAAAEGRRLELRTDPELLVTRLGEERIEAMRVGAQDASFTVDDGTVEVVGGTPGFDFVAEDTAPAVIEAALESEDRTAELQGKRPEPEFTREDAEALQITEEVSTFTTDHAPGEPRVHNIQLLADLVDGVIVEPDERFSINDDVGPRTREGGFVEGGVIQDGEFEEEVGGGVSQFATTFFNAAFFAGIEIEEYQPHSYYIERYPIGHEATLAYGAIDLAIVNDSPHGLLIKTSYTATSITVTFYSSPWADVEVEVGPRRNVVPGDNRDGFDVTFTRTITYPDGESVTEEHFHRYQPENEAD
jgi:vancomycin resistance protein YoaR